MHLASSAHPGELLLLLGTLCAAVVVVGNWLDVQTQVCLHQMGCTTCERRECRVPRQIAGNDS
jgi:hypothetical protein